MPQHPRLPRAREPREKNHRTRAECQRRVLRNQWRGPSRARLPARDRSPERHPVHQSPERAQTRSDQAQNQKAAEGGRMGMSLVFHGTPEFAVPTLDRIIAAGHSVSEVVTQPDRPKGRKQELTPSPVKAAALRHTVPVYQPERIRHADSVEHLRALAPDAMVVVGYGQIIPQSIIDI